MTLYRASRPAGTLPASLIIRKICSRARPAGLSALAAWAIRSSSSVPLTSSAPKWGGGGAGVADLVGEGDEGQEASRPVLLFSQAQEVLHALGAGLDVAVEHGGVSRDAERGGDAVGLAPPIGISLARVPELFREPLGENLGGAPRAATEAPG